VNRTIDRMKLFFLGVFALSCAAVWAYQVIYVWPARRCEAAGNWWDPEGRQCATPIDLRAFPRIAPPPEGAHNPPPPEVLADPSAPIPAPTPVPRQPAPKSAAPATAH
jgi:hypothetical protein